LIDLAGGWTGVKFGLSDCLSQFKNWKTKKLNGKIDWAKPGLSDCIVLANILASLGVIFVAKIEGIFFHLSITCQIEQRTFCLDYFLINLKEISAIFFYCT
jgi:hypothetical protein